MQNKKAAAPKPAPETLIRTLSACPQEIRLEVVWPYGVKGSARQIHEAAVDGHMISTVARQRMKGAGIRIDPEFGARVVVTVHQKNRAGTPKEKYKLLG